MALAKDTTKPAQLIKFPTNGNSFCPPQPEIVIPFDDIRKGIERTLILVADRAAKGEPLERARLLGMSAEALRFIINNRHKDLELRTR